MDRGDDSAGRPAVRVAGADPRDPLDLLGGEASRLAGMRRVFPLLRVLTVTALAAVAIIGVLLVGSTPAHAGCAVLACFVLYCLDSLQHEAVHGFLTRASRVNRVVGLLAALPTLRPYSEYRAYHLAHHAFAAGKRDPEGSHVYLSPRGLVLLPVLTGRFWAGRIAASVAVAVGRPGAWYVRTPGQRRAVRVDLSITAAVAAALVTGAVVSAGVRWCWLYPFLAYVLIIFPFVHTFEHFGAQADGRPDRVGLTASVTLARPIAWVFGYGNLHTAHHLFPRVAGAHLPLLHTALLVARPDVRVYRGYVGFFRSAVRSMRSVRDSA